MLIKESMGNGSLKYKAKGSDLNYKRILKFILDNISSNDVSEMLVSHFLDVHASERLKAIHIFK